MTASLANTAFPQRGARLLTFELWSAVALALIVAACAFTFLLSPLAPAAQAQAIALISLAAPAVAGVASFLVGLRGPGIERRGWLWVASGALAWAIGTALRMQQGLSGAFDPLSPSTLDTPYLVSLPMIAVALLVTLTRSSRSEMSRARWLDVAIVACGIVTVAWFFVFAPILAAEAAGLLDLSMRLALPAGSVMSLLAITIAAACRPSEQARAQARALMAGVACLGSSSLIVTFLALHDTEALAAVSSLGWCVGFVLVAYSALVRWLRPAGLEASEGVSSRLRWPDVVWQYASAALVIAIACLIWLSDARLHGAPGRWFLALALATIGLFVLRQVVQLREQAQLARSLRSSADDFEQAVAQRTQEAQRLVSIFDNTPDVVAATDVDGRVLYVNEGGRRLLGLSPEEDVTARSLPDLHPAWAVRLITDRGIPAALATGTWEGETAFLNANGDEVAVSQVILAHRDPDGRVEFLSTIAREITTQKAYESHLLHLSSHDALTGVFNRAFIVEKLSLEMEWGRPIALAYLDLDNFKLVNDAIGHGAGDELLIAVADVIGSTIREADVLARLGGDEFAVLFPNTDTEGATRVVERMLAGIRERVFIIAGRPVRITASVGIALAPTHGREATDLLAHADMALYRAKVDRDSYRMYAPDKDSQQSLEHDRVVELQVRDALQEDRLMLFAQRVVPLDGQAPDQFEVLLRLMGEDGAIVPPNQFLPLAERSNLIVEIDRWVCRATIDFLVTYGSAAAPVVHVNLSGKAIGDAQLIVELKQLLATYAFDPSRIVFEITETAAVTNLGAASQFIQTLKGLGFRFALDDFGVGYSSISHLKNLDVDYLKLDGSFITNLTRDTRDQHLVRAIVELAKALDKETVAEYVGDQETVDALRSLGVDFGQGYFLGRPGPIREVIDGARSFEAPAPPRFEGAQSVVPATEH